MQSRVRVGSAHRKRIDYFSVSDCGQLPRLSLSLTSLELAPRYLSIHFCAVPKMLPLGLLTAAQGHPMLVELKNGETLNGHLVNCDNWMNLTLKEVVQTTPEGDRFFRLPEVYVRGNNIKYLRVPEEILDIVKEQQQNQSSGRGGRGGRGDGKERGRGGRGGRGRGRGRGG
ncbi:U6 snRNA-associated Sm-like protein LSM4, putative [Talaromyces marneffei ATCC 18224]|uniref:LSM complex subunit LSM4 n=2 Tax=Talaromyces marneffei TaxID=37727 RepID=B6QK53_TALMQ|nr:U6 snRNA-associated Sm-like protein LSM4, putative [Talaromyces marneffei ATCC 18224]